MYQSDEFRSSVMPIVIANSICCTGLLEYFIDQSTQTIGFVYAVFALSSYCTIFYKIMDVLHKKWLEEMADFVLIMSHIQYCHNVIVYVLTIFAGVFRRKKVRLFMRQLENCAGAMNELGIAGSYSAVITHKYLVILCFFFIIIGTVIAEIAWVFNSRENYVIIILYCIVDNIPPIVALIVDSSFAYWTRYTKTKLGQLNTELKNMLTTTIESPQHRRVLRVRDKWKDTSPSSNIYRNYKMNENVRKLKRIKQIHLELIKFARITNEAYSFHILVSMTTCFLLITALLYNLYISIVEYKASFLSINIFVFCYWIFFLGFKVILVNHMCAVTVMETGDILCELYEPSVSKELREAIREFMHQLVQNPLTFTACGFFDLDYTFVNTTIGSVATYLVILIQVGHGPTKVSNHTVVQNSTSKV